MESIEHLYAHVGLVPDEDGPEKLIYYAFVEVGPCKEMIGGTGNISTSISETLPLNFIDSSRADSEVQISQIELPQNNEVKIIDSPESGNSNNNNLIDSIDLSPAETLEAVTSDAKLSPGTLLKFREFKEPYIYIEMYMNLRGVINSLTGQYHQFASSNLRIFPEQTLKYDPEKGYKFIVPESRIWYHSESHNRLYRCFFRSIWMRSADCEELGAVKDVKWKNIYPEDAFPYIEDLALVSSEGGFPSGTTLVKKRKYSAFQGDNGDEVNSNNNNAQTPSDVDFSAGMQLKYHEDDVPYLFVGRYRRSCRSFLL
ncbi:MAG: hypothetical protein K2Z81_06100 [Cyanobacteria bacterium]|nr:hypothetical protein [Cyanobacteriota bacterium]